VASEKGKARWIDAARAGHARAVARLITFVESDPAAAQTIIRDLYPDTGQAHIVGLTGPPGAGKSSLVNELAKAFRRRNRRVGIVAVDPSSPFTGGALLGDRVRMQELAGDDGIFVRSMASRGNLGGLARTTASVVKVLDAAGYEVILVETVGAGQAEVDIAGAAHTVVVLEAPGMGDDVQSIKAGILEIADILVVNKADQPGAQRTVRNLEMMLRPAMPPPADPTHRDRGHRLSTAPRVLEAAASDDWRVPVLSTTATTGAGIEELTEAIELHRLWLLSTGGWAVRERARSRREIEHLLRDRYIDELKAQVPADKLTDLITAVVERRLDPYAAADQLYSIAEAARSPA